MTDTETKRDQLDPQTLETLENSLAIQILKLFAIVAKADMVVTDQEREFVRNYCKQLYPRKIANYLFGRFESFLEEFFNYHTVARQINKQLSYQEKIFCLFKTYELILADEVDQKEISLIHNIAKVMNIEPEDYVFIEKVFGIIEGDPNATDNKTIIRVLVTGDLATGDIYIPIDGFHLEIYKIYELYCLRLVDENTDVTVDGRHISTTVFTRVPHNADILINQYTLKYHNLKVYFENRIHPLQTDLFLRVDNGHYSWDRIRNEKSALHLRLEGSRMQLATVEGAMLPCSINGRDVSDLEWSYVNLDDRVVVNNEDVLNLREIFFHLNREKDIPLAQGAEEYLISNDPRGDIFIADDLKEKWTVRLYRNDQGYFISQGDCPYQVRISGKNLKEDRKISSGETIYISNRFLVPDFENLTIRQMLFSFEKLVAEAVDFAFADGTKGLNSISFGITHGDLVCIMGPSGCGKSTLLSIISGFAKPLMGKIQLGDHNLHDDYTLVKDYLGFVPQDDLLLANLTVYENLFYYAKLRFPDRTKQELDPQIDLVLRDVGLYEKKDTKVGSPVDKRLSGGQRKRLNIGLELLANAEVYLLDEPTSGLSSKDSENIVELLANISARGKIVIAVIHQPSSKLYKMFNKVVLLDKGGHLAYFGSTYSALSYFKGYRDSSHVGADEEVECPHCKTVQPDLLLDTLEESLRDIDGTRLSERKYSPQYWKEQYKDYIKDKETAEAALPELGALPPPQILTFKDRVDQFKTLLSRNFRSKIRDRANLVITFLGAPFLGWGVGWVSKFSPQDQYTLLSNDLFETFLFTSVIVAMFFSMTNSVDEIISDRAIFLREKMLSLQNRSYLASKVAVLLLFALIQNMLFVGTGFLVLDVKELYWGHVLFLTLVSFAGTGLGLFISSIPNISSKAAQNMIPLILIPQIVLGGSLIVYEDMNREMRFFKESPIPEICQIIPSRWAFEGIMVLQYQYNSFDTEYDRLGQEWNDLKRDRKEFWSKKDELIAQHGEEWFNEKKKEISKAIDAKEAERETLRSTVGKLYGNSSIFNKVSMADRAFEQKTTAVYKMLVSHKTLPFVEKKVSTVVYNGLVVIGSGLLLLSLTLLMLRFRDGIISWSVSARIIWDRIFNPPPSKPKPASESSAG